MPEAPTEVVIGDWTQDEASAFIDREWPPHDAHLGHVWNPQELVLCARSGGEAVGVARGVANGGVGELKHLLVRKDRAHGGIGSRLLLEFEARCRALGCHKLRLETAEWQARPFYERHGFVVAAVLANDRFGKQWFVMEKQLAGAGA